MKKLFIAMFLMSLILALTVAVSAETEVGDIIKLGSYEQDNILTNGTEPIEWRVLAVEDGKALLVSEYALDTKPFNNTPNIVTWERCNLRNWLNTDFYENAFTEEEKGRIELTTVKNPDNPISGIKGGNDTKDRLFLLSFDEVNEYFTSDNERQCQPTLYAEANGGSFVVFDETHVRGTWWWLRTPGANDLIIACVFPHGEAKYEGLYVTEAITVIRPAMWLDL